MPKIFFKQGYLGTSNHYLPNKVPFYSFKYPFPFFGRLSMILDYSLFGLGILDIDTQLNFLELKLIKILLNPANALWKGSSDPSLLVGGMKFFKFIEFLL